MGGNLKLGTYEAERIVVSIDNRKKLIGLFITSILDLNLQFENRFGFRLWNQETINTLAFASGSSRHFFDTTISDVDFVAVKPSVGDLDLQVPSSAMEQLSALLSEDDVRLGDLQLLGTKDSVMQTISLWYSESLKQNIQIDFEYVDFENGQPSFWASFSHSSDWKDLQLGLKGVCHKLLLRALTTKTLTLKRIRYGKTNREKIEVSSEFAFSVLHGLRRKLLLDSDGIYRELQPNDSVYTKDLNEIGKQLIHPDFSDTEADLLCSSRGIMELVNKYWSQADITGMQIGFIHSLWGEGAQLLYRNDLERDLAEKSAMFNFVVGTDLPTEYLSKYYEFKRLTS